MTPMDMAYYMWLVTNGEHSVVVDLGFTREMCAKRGRQWLHEPAGLFDQVGFPTDKIEHVIVSHMHWDHVGNYKLFPNAKFYIQEDEMTFWTGKYVKYPVFQHAIEVEDVVEMVRYNYAGRLYFPDSGDEIVPGVKVHKVGGHTKGIMITEVPTASGTAVIASDAVHTYANLRSNTPFTIIHSVPDFIDGFNTMRRLAADEDHILPGHDADVMNRHPLVHEDIALLK